jgi:hypothetical protein
MSLKKIKSWFTPSNNSWDSRMDGWFDKSDEECERIMEEINGKN